jgi:hypothetical protein
MPRPSQAIKPSILTAHYSSRSTSSTTFPTPETSMKRRRRASHRGSASRTRMLGGRLPNLKCVWPPANRYCSTGGRASVSSAFGCGRTSRGRWHVGGFVGGRQPIASGLSESERPHEPRNCGSVGAVLLWGWGGDLLNASVSGVRIL